ncbi:MAG: glycosidase [Candidatus Eremiobacteraeota bacterium]|nr:glycosidase [Candidatus Eremiobacteraeota bacterium]MBV8583159.1 glycosidase [Candidatus Eremiobacteraeota bacterium]
MIDEFATRVVADVQRLGVVMEPDGSPLEVEGVLNPALTRGRKDELLMYPRVVARGNTSRVGLSRGVETNGKVQFERIGFALEPEADYELRSVPGGMGCEDPRVTFVPVLDKYVMAYTAFGPEGPRVSLAVSEDGYKWQRLGRMKFVGELMPVGDDKDGVFFPEPVTSPSGVKSLAMYHRPMLHISALDGHAAIPTILEMDPEDRECIRIAYIPLDAALKDPANLLIATESVKVVIPDGHWGRIKNGGGTPPVRTDKGWLSLFHGVDAVEHEGRITLCYSAGIVLHDLEEPHRVLYRSPEPVLSPDTVEERTGIVNNVVFPTGIDPKGDGTYDVYYGAADAKVARARINVEIESV